MAAVRYVTEALQKEQTGRQISGEKWTESWRDLSPSWNSDAAPSTPAPLPPYQHGCPALLIKPVASESLVEIDCAAVSIVSFSLLSSWLSDSLAQSPAGYLFVMDFSHLRLSSSSLQPQSESVGLEASFTY